VKDPAPTMRGNTKGTMEETSGGPLWRNTSISKVISTATAKITIAPATANEDIFTPNIASTPSPRKKKPIKRAKEIKEIFRAGTPPGFFWKSMMIGIEPIISMMANKTVKALSISFKLIFIVIIFCKNSAFSEILSTFAKELFIL